MSAELIYGQKPIMPIEQSILSWSTFPWYEGMTREELLALRIRQLERRDKDVATVVNRLQKARLANKKLFDKKHHLRPRSIQVGDWVLVYDSSLDNQHSTIRKFSKQWFGPYIVKEAHDNATYALTELDGFELRVQVAGKRVKLFKQGGKDCVDEILANNFYEDYIGEESNMDETT